MGMMQQLFQAKSAYGDQQEEKSAAGDTQTMTAAAPEGHRAKKGMLTQELEPQQKLLKGGKCPATAAERRVDQDLPMTRAGDKRFQLAWARWRRPTLSGTPWRPPRSFMELHEPPWSSMSLHGPP